MGRGGQGREPEAEGEREGGEEAAGRGHAPRFSQAAGRAQINWP
jgi:hypothetical protein